MRLARSLFLPPGGERCRRLRFSRPAHGGKDGISHLGCILQELLGVGCTVQGFLGCRVLWVSLMRGGARHPPSLHPAWREACSSGLGGGLCTSGFLGV